MSSRTIGSFASLFLVLVLSAGLIVSCGPDASLTASAVVDRIVLSAASTLLGVEGGDVTVEATVFDASGAPVGGVRVTFETTAGEFPNGNVVQTDPAGKARALLRTSNRAVVKARVLDIVSEEVVIEVEVPVVLEFSQTPEVPIVDEPVQFTFTAVTKKEGKAVEGELEIDYGDRTSETIRDFRKKATRKHTYTKVDGFRVKLTLTQDSGQVSHTSNRVKVSEPIPVSLQLQVAAAEPGDPTAVTVKADREDGKPARGTVEIDFGDGESTTVKNFERKATRRHTYEEEGKYKVKAKFVGDEGAADATEQASVEISETPTGGTGGDGTDDINASSVVYLHANISSWAVTSTVTRVTIDPGSQICIFHTKAGKWPTPFEHNVEGNVWAFANINGTWHGATWEWIRSGQVCKHIEKEWPRFATPAPMSSWRPRSGELVGFGTSTHARNARRTINERSNIVLVPWP